MENLCVLFENDFLAMVVIDHISKLDLDNFAVFCNVTGVLSVMEKR